MSTHEQYVLGCDSIMTLHKMDSESIIFNDRPFMTRVGFPFSLLTGQSRITRLDVTAPPKDHVSWMFDVVKQERYTHVFALPLSIYSMLERQVMQLQEAIRACN